MPGVNGSFLPADCACAQAPGAEIRTSLARTPRASTDRYDTAISYFSRSLKMYEAMGAKGGIVLSLGNIGQLYLILEKTDEAIAHIERSILVSKEIQDVEGLQFGYELVAQAYSKKGEYEKAYIAHQTIAILL